MGNGVELVAFNVRVGDDGLKTKTSVGCELNLFSKVRWGSVPEVGTDRR